MRHALLALGEHASAAGFDEAIDLASFRALLGQVLDARPSAQGFLAGGVTFCQLMPMRSIRFACLPAWPPRRRVQASDVRWTDLLAKQRRPETGPARRRPQLFLEALLSARRNFLITYIGQSIHDGKPLLPSVLVTELLDHLSRGFTVASSGQERSNEGSLESVLVTRHALLAVSPRYFRPGEDPRLFSYAAWALAGARAVSEPKRPTRPFFAQSPRCSRSRPPPALVAARRAGRVPGRPAANVRAAAAWPDARRDLESAVDREPFELDALERWHFVEAICWYWRSTRRASGSLELARARGVLPLALQACSHSASSIDSRRNRRRRSIRMHGRGGSPRWRSTCSSARRD